MFFLKNRAAIVGMILFFSGQGTAVANVIEKNTQSFSVKLGASRVIHSTDSKGSVLSVMNEHDYPMLIQTKITPDDEMDDSVKARFIANPPIFRLDSNQRAKLRIVHSGGQVATDRESLFWVCVKGIPPSGDQHWSEGKVPESAMLNVQMIVNNCIKLLVRPKSLVGQDALAMAERLSWRQSGNKLTATNPSPFYINLSALSVGGVALGDVRHIAPFSSHTFSVPAGAKGTVEWRALSDLGGEGPQLSSAPN
ncbi:fimbria/pilus periplasmic chaperone [Aeromonas salmonicida]